MTRRARSEHGQSTVEFALALPLVVVILAALFEVGMIGLDQMRLWHAAREAARTAVVDADERAIRTAAERSGLSPLALTVEPDTLHRTTGAPLTVAVSYEPDTRVPVIGSLLDGISLHATATMRIERP